MPPRVPDDGPITIDINAPDVPAPQAEQQPARQPGPPYIDRVPLGVAPDAEPPVDEGPDLEKQLRDMQKREKAAADRAVLERNQRIAAEQRAQQTVSQTTIEKETSDYYSVTNALAAKTGELNQAKADYANALQAGDMAQASEINVHVMNLQLDIRDLGAGKQDFEQRFEQRRRQPPQRPQQPQQPQPQQQLQQPPDIETVLASMPNLLESEKQWARKHPEVVFDANKYQQLAAAYRAWESTNQPRGTPEYFAYFDQQLGLTDDDQAAYDDEGARQPMVQQQPQLSPSPQRRGPQTAAPVSRTAPGAASRQTFGNSDSQITLSTQQREAARFSHLDEKTYARNVARLNDLKRRGYYQETG